MECLDIRVGTRVKEGTRVNVGTGWAGEMGVYCLIFGPCRGSSASAGVVGSASSCARRRRLRRRNRNAKTASMAKRTARTPITIPIIAGVPRPAAAAFPDEGLVGCRLGFDWSKLGAEEPSKALGSETVEKTEIESRSMKGPVPSCCPGFVTINVCSEESRSLA